MSILLRYADYASPPVEFGPAIITRQATTLPVPTETAPNAAIGFSAIARIHPRGLPCSWWIEYGTTQAYGSTTEPRALPGILGAYYEENWTEGLNAYRGGLFHASLTHKSEGFVRYATEGPLGDDNNHQGIGYVHLPIFGYLGRYDPGFAGPKLGGGYPDIRGAELELCMHGSGWRPNGVQLAAWAQRNLNDGGQGERRTNWVNTRNLHGWAAVAGEKYAWNTARWTLKNNPHEWTYAGRLTNDPDGDFYFYQELDTALADNEINLFPVIIININTEAPRPTGNLDFDRFSIRYRQHSVCVSSNGGELIDSPTGGSGTNFLTDGWRNGEGREWVSSGSPSFPLDFVYSFVNSVEVDRVMIHNGVTAGCRNYEIALSSNGTDWTTIGTGELPETHENGANFLYALVEAGHTTASFLRVRITSAWDTGVCRLGEIEVFGTGAVEETDDDWYDVNHDIIVSSGTYHYRVVAETDEGIIYGLDNVVVVP